MTKDRQDRIRDVLSELGADWALLSTPDAVCYATGQVIPIETGPSPFTGGPALAFIGRQGGTGLVCSNVEATDLPATLDAEIYTGFAGNVVDQITNYRAAVQRIVRHLNVDGRVAIQMGSHPACLHDLIPITIPIDNMFQRARAIKTPSEIAALRAAATVASAGQIAARNVSRAGISEIEALNAIRGVMEQKAGERCALAGEYLGGIDHSATLGTKPGPRRLLEGDPVLCDLAPRVAGYWGDSCNSFTLGAPSEAWRTIYTTVHETLMLAISTLRPGITVHAFDTSLRENMQKVGLVYPHHSGHGIGTSVHEWPRIVPHEYGLIEENMVLMVEPGAYVPGVGGLRCEHMLRVTATGAEVLTDFAMGVSE
ncbi:M24 family metallopeptidase [Pararhizobium sp. PWRC1-1]|uniref:M24 family metallopeptidase n=1 Tax=Pararhizobium sp. PWRC1-1 TaxID=2804566 RepID=UPI003CF1FD65